MSRYYSRGVPPEADTAEEAEAYLDEVEEQIEEARAAPRESERPNPWERW